ncbi:MAG: hypothetical protein RLZZ341_1495, partial [Pseudomonadota bacterium]
AARPASDLAEVCWLLVGTALAAGGVAVLNQWLEHETDARMARTADRPIPTGKVPTGSAFVLGALMCIVALFLLFGRVDRLAALFTLLDDGAIAPRVQRVFALDEAVEAHRLIEAGEVEGRLVLDPGLPMGAAAVDALRAASPQAAAPPRRTTG